MSMCGCFCALQEEEHSAQSKARLQSTTVTTPAGRRRAAAIINAQWAAHCGARVYFEPLSVQEMATVGITLCIYIKHSGHSAY